tara:strand:- start:792 stop:1730 length:939 start_codon:yes stop_codon:yes gene_type:complete
MADITKTQSLPAPFIEGLGKTFAEGLTKTVGQPIDTTKFQPTVAGQGALGQEAQKAAASQAGLGALTFDATTGAVTGVGQGTGIAGYQPFLDQAGTYGTAAAGLTGTGAGTGAGSIESYMSPYTTNVIQAMQDQMADVKSQQDIARNASAVGAGAFGGARQGVAQSVADTEYNRMVGQMVAQQQGMGYQQAAGARQQDYMNQMGLAQNQQGLAQLQPQLAAQNVGNISQLGQNEQAYRQTLADTAAAQQKLSLYEPYQRYGFFGEQLAGLMGGYPGGTRMQSTPSQSPMSQALGMGIGAMGTYAGMKNAGMF